MTTKIDGHAIKMELDTGSAVSIIPLQKYKQMFRRRIPLEKTEVTLKTYSGESMTPEGIINVPIQYNHQIKALPLFVVNTAGPALFGRDWLHEFDLDWKVVKSITKNSKKDTQKKLKKLLDEYSEIFQEEIGTFKSTKAKLPLKEGYHPKFCKARPVPYALKPKVDAELKHLESEGILEKVTKAKLPLKEGYQPKFCKARLGPYALKPKVDAELKHLESEGILEKVTFSDWATPIVPVVKPNGEVIICGDFKVTVNPQIETEQYPLPRIDDIFASLAGGDRFTKIDLRQAYHQMEVEQESRNSLTINTHQGLYRYNRLVFGVTSAPAIWQRSMDQGLEGVNGTSCILDDMIITGKDDDEHLENRKEVLKRLKEHGLRAKMEKCAFFQERISYCGHEVDRDGLHKTTEKVQAVVDAPQPTNTRQLRSFLGLVNYYHKFLPNLATILHPLNRLLEQGRKCEWTEECSSAFSKVKELITSDMVLIHYDPKFPLKLACDDSPVGIGAVLSHVMQDGTERPIAFASRTLTKTEQNYSQIDKEALVLVWGVKKFHLYLFGRHFTLVTEHEPLTAIFNPKKGIPAMTVARLQRYALFLAGFEYSTEYKSTSQHGNADGLSRLPLKERENTEIIDPAEVFQVSQVEMLPVSAEMIHRETLRDPTLSQVLEHVRLGWKPVNAKALEPFYRRKEEITVQDGCLMWGSRVIIPPKLQKRVLDELHEGHLGIVKMKALARSYMWWPSIDQSIEAMAKTCSGCQLIQNNPKNAPLHPWEWPARPWQRVHIDFAGPFLGTMFSIVVDAYSKWPEVVPMTTTSTTKTIEELRSMFARNGIPDQIVSDNGPQFIATEFSVFVKNNGIKHIRSAPYHPATNGLAERFVQTFKQGMRASKSNQSISSKLANRTAPHTTTGQSPSMLFMGRNLRTKLDVLKPDVRKRVEDKQLNQAVKNPSLSQTFRLTKMWLRGTTGEETSGFQELSLHKQDHCLIKLELHQTQYGIDTRTN